MFNAWSEYITRHRQQMWNWIFAKKEPKKVVFVDDKIEPPVAASPNDYSELNAKLMEEKRKRKMDHSEEITTKRCKNN